MYVLSGNKTGFNPYRFVIWCLTHSYVPSGILSGLSIILMSLTGWTWLTVPIILFGAFAAGSGFWRFLEWSIDENGPERLMDSLRAKADNYRKIED